MLSESSLLCKNNDILGEIRIMKIAGSNNWQSLQVRAVDDDSFFIHTTCKTLTFRDEEIQKNEEGKYIINIEPLNLPFYYGDAPVPTEVEIPGEVLEARKEKRMLKALAKDAICIIPYQGESMYFYLEGDKLRILHKEKEVTADKIEVIHGKKAVNVEGLELGHPYLELPVNVTSQFEKVLLEKELKKLALVLKGKSLLNSRKYYGFNMETPSNLWNLVKGNFEYFDTDEGELQGWLTCVPGRVAEILKIPIQ
jgi:hypothetical protein